MQKGWLDFYDFVVDTTEVMEIVNQNANLPLKGFAQKVSNDILLGKKVLTRE